MLAIELLAFLTSHFATTYILTDAAAISTLRGASANARCQKCVSTRTAQ